MFVGRQHACRRWSVTCCHLGRCARLIVRHACLGAASFTSLVFGSVQHASAALQSWEARLVRRFPGLTWLGKDVTDFEGRTMRAPSRWAMLLIRYAWEWLVWQEAASKAGVY